MGKFGKYYLHDWYARKRDTTASIAEERGAVQAYEEELMQEALGLKPKKLLLAKKQMNEEELKDFLKAKKNDEGREAMGPQKKVMRNELGEEVVTSNEDQMAQAVRDGTLKGLGFASHRDAKLERIKAQTLGTESELKGLKELPKAPVKGEVMKLEVKTEVKTEIDAVASGSSKVESEGSCALASPLSQLACKWANFHHVPEKSVGFEMNGDELDLQKTPADYSFDPSKQVELLCFPKMEEFMEPDPKAGLVMAEGETPYFFVPHAVLILLLCLISLMLGAHKSAKEEAVKDEAKEEEEVAGRSEDDTKAEKKDKKEKKKDKKAKKAAKKLKKMEKKVAKKEKKAKKEAKLLQIERAMQELQTKCPI
eukprot:g11650.t1